ncbi:MAG: hypothetical protein SF069_03065 [Phycisphaerae bacterium]|nr:hypothetical protein [Phycisphaerae bacterium]
MNATIFPPNIVIPKEVLEALAGTCARNDLKGKIGELNVIRTAIGVLRETEALREDEVIELMTRDGLKSVDADGLLATLVAPEKKTVDVELFLEACRAVDVDGSRAVKRSVTYTDAEKLLGDAVEDVVDYSDGTPYVKLSGASETPRGDADKPKRSRKAVSR